MDIIIALLFWAYFLCYISIGFYQPLSALNRLINSDDQNASYQNGLKSYLLSVTVYFVFLFIATHLGYDGACIALYLFILPYVFLIWYLIFTKKWDKKLENIRAYDRTKLLEAPHPDRLELEALPHKVVQIVKLKSQLKLKIG